MITDLPTQRARLQEQNGSLRQRERQFSELFNACYDGLFVVDVENGRIAEVNAPALRLAGYSREEILNLALSDLYPYELPRFRDFVEEVRRPGRSRSRELTCRTKSGELIPVQMSATVLVYEGRSSLLLLVQDMRDHRLAEIGLAVSKISHDLRGILATAVLLADRMTDSVDPECRRIGPRLISSIDRAVALCTETLARGRATTPPPSYAACKLRPLAEEVAAIANVAGAGNVAWRNEIPREFVLTADPDHLFRALLNIVRNAREALERKGGGEIRLSALRDGDSVKIDIADTGPGIPPELRERLFQPFAGFGRPDSTGLGLTIARELMRGHGGDVMLHKTGPEGAVFRVELPARHGRQSEPAGAKTREKARDRFARRSSPTPQPSKI